MDILKAFKLFNKDININININDTKENKTNYDYYMDKLKKNCSYF